MTEWRGYMYCENLALTGANRDTLIDQLKLLGQRNNSEMPNERNHWRVRQDNEAVIFEAVFDDANLTAAAIKARLVAIFGVPAAQVTYATVTTAYGPVVTYTYASVARLRFGVFGGVSSTYEQSWSAVLAYITANQAAWNPAI